MSTFRADNFGPSAGGTTRSLRGIAAAWANLNGTGTIALRDSENVSSVIDNGVGSYVFNYSNSFSSENSQSSALGPRGNNTNGASLYNDFNTDTAIRVIYALPGTSFYDTDMVALSCHGDLA